MHRLLVLQQRRKMKSTRIHMRVFELENGVPTYGYDLAQAVKDGYLVDYMSVESKLKFIEQGIVYDELIRRGQRRHMKKLFEDEARRNSRKQ